MSVNCAQMKNARSNKGVPAAQILRPVEALISPRSPELDAPPGILRTLFSAEHSPFVAAAQALLAEGHAPETEIAMKPRGSTIVADARRDRHPLGAHGRGCEPRKARRRPIRACRAAISLRRAHREHPAFRMLPCATHPTTIIG